MKEESGLNHFEGRSWHGFHRHAMLVMLAYGFLTLERLRLQQQEGGHPATSVPAKKKAPLWQTAAKRSRCLAFLLVSDILVPRDRSRRAHVHNQKK
jgi:hypothetical protein